MINQKLKNKCKKSPKTSLLDWKIKINPKRYKKLWVKLPPMMVESKKWEIKCSKKKKEKSKKLKKKNSWEKYLQIIYLFLVKLKFVSSLKSVYVIKEKDVNILII